MDSEFGIPYTRLRTPNGEELRIAKLTGTDLSQILLVSTRLKKKADLLQDFLDWLNQGHNFLISSPDLLAYATHEQYGSVSKNYYMSVKRRVHSLLRGKTLILDEYHQYDPFTLINIENLLTDTNLSPERVLLLSATRRQDYFCTIPEIPVTDNMPAPVGEPRLASRKIQVNFHFKSDIPEPEETSTGLTLFIHNSVVQNRRRCARLRSQGVKIVQWDGTRKDNEQEELGKSIHLVLGTSAIEVGLDLDADTLFTEWNLRWMNPNQITQRIGRVGRRDGNTPATVNIYSNDALDREISKMLKYHNTSMTKTELNNKLNNILYEVCHTRSLNRENYVSNYYNPEGITKLQRKRLLRPHEELLYHFRPPGTQALFLDKTEVDQRPFIYDKTPMLNRYETTHAMPDDVDELDMGWKALCEALHIDIEEDFLIIRGERQKREWLDSPSGDIKDLEKPNLKKYYIKMGRRGTDDSQII